MSSPKFSVNKFGVVNSRGDQVSAQYLRAYVECWCRKADGYTVDRSKWLDYFTSDEFITQHAGKTASQIGKAAKLVWDAAIKASTAAPVISKPAAKVYSRAEADQIDAEYMKDID